MKIELSQFKPFPSMSEETMAYTAVVKINGVPAFHAKNSGTGGADLYTPLDARGRDLLKQAEDYAASLPRDPRFPNLPMDLEMLLGTIMSDTLAAADLRKGLKTYAIFQHDGKIKQAGKRGIKVENAIAHVQTKYPDAPVLNLLPFDKALEIYKAALS